MYKQVCSDDLLLWLKYIIGLRIERDAIDFGGGIETTKPSYIQGRSNGASFSFV